MEVPNLQTPQLSSCWKVVCQDTRHTAFSSVPSFDSKQSQWRPQKHINDQGNRGISLWQPFFIKPGKQFFHLPTQTEASGLFTQSRGGGAKLWKGKKQKQRAGMHFHILCHIKYPLIMQNTKSLAYCFKKYIYFLGATWSGNIWVNFLVFLLMQQVFPTPSHPLRSDIWASGLYTLYCVAWSASKMDSWTLPEITSNQEAHQLWYFLEIIQLIHYKQLWSFNLFSTNFNTLSPLPLTPTVKR